jgi:hypothetical protein
MSRTRNNTKLGSYSALNNSYKPTIITHARDAQNKDAQVGPEDPLILLKHFNATSICFPTDVMGLSKWKMWDNF